MPPLSTERALVGAPSRSLNKGIGRIMASHRSKIVFLNQILDKVVTRVGKSVQILDERSRLVVDNLSLVSEGHSCDLSEL